MRDTFTPKFTRPSRSWRDHSAWAEAPDATRFELEQKPPYPPRATSPSFVTDSRNPQNPLAAIILGFSNMASGIHGERPHEEYQYLNLIRQILANGEHRPDRYFARGYWDTSNTGPEREQEPCLSSLHRHSAFPSLALQQIHLNPQSQFSPS